MLNNMGNQLAWFISLNVTLNQHNQHKQKYIPLKMLKNKVWWKYSAADTEPMV